MSVTDTEHRQQSSSLIGTSGVTKQHDAVVIETHQDPDGLLPCQLRFSIITDSDGKHIRLAMIHQNSIDDHRTSAAWSGSSQWWTLQLAAALAGTTIHIHGQPNGDFALRAVDNDLYLLLVSSYPSSDECVTVWCHLTYEELGQVRDTIEILSKSIYH